MKKISIFLFLSASYIILSAFLSSCSTQQKLIAVGKGYSCTSVNTTIFRHSSLTTFGDEQYISYYDPEGYVTIGKRKLNSKIWTIQRSPYKGKVTDAHNIISIMVDGNGYLHAAFDHHNNSLNYCRSIAPGSIILGPKQQMIGKEENDVTYPEFYRLASGDLIFIYRSGMSGNGNLVMNKYSIQTKQWTRIQDVLIDGENKRNAYWQLFVDRAGTIHLSWVWRETYNVETNHDICYARSFDDGKSWYKTNGEKYTLPITYENAEYACHIPQKSELINQTSMSTDEKGNPYIATYWKNTDSKIPQYRVIWFDGEKWNNRQVGNRKTPFSLSGSGTKMIPISRPQMVVKGKKIYYIFRDTERGSKVSLATCRNINKRNWEVHDLTSFNVDAWEPSLDTELWKRNHKLDIFVLKALQGDGEKVETIDPQMVYVLEARL
ncbi:MAG: BNR repeat-containing protein [Bacteroidaceae bacterium]|nr:BNR repeat-containing protein [Bacteroidaceae bacterium]